MLYWPNGAVAKWPNAAVCKTDIRRFDSGLRLPVYICLGGGMVDTRDLKSLGSNTVWVRVPPEAQTNKTPLRGFIFVT